MNNEIYKDLDNLYESIESLNNKIKRQERELELAYKGIEQLNNIIHNAIEFIYDNAYDSERKSCIDDLWGEIPKLLKILKGETK